MTRRAIASVLVLCACAIAQSPTVAPSSAPTRFMTYYQLPGKLWSAWLPVVIDPPLALTVDAAGVPHLGLTPGAAANTLTFGKGFTTAASDVQQTQVFLDTAVVSYRVQPPAAPGPCTGGTGAWAVDAAAIYVCAPNAAGDGFNWARLALSTSW